MPITGLILVHGNSYRKPDGRFAARLRVLDRYFVASPSVSAPSDEQRQRCRVG